MAKKKSPNKTDIMTYYMDYVLEHDSRPKSVYSFAKSNGFDEAKFYEFFTSFDVLEAQVFQTFFEASVKVIESSDDYMTYDARQKLLSFYYTFFENLTANRSFVLYLLGQGESVKSLKSLKELKKSFNAFIGELEIETVDLKQEKLEKLKDRSIEETAWLQLLITMKFWMDDTSSGFEKTDIFIEKSVNTSFDLIDIKPLSSLLDLGKFLVKEKMQMN